MAFSQKTIKKPIKMKKIKLLFILQIIAALIFSYEAVAKNQISDKSPSVFIPFQGDFADPTIVRDGKDFYLTHTSYGYYPGLLIWHSTDLIHWKPICRALKTNVGEVWAPEMIIFNNKYYIYFPTDLGANYLITADNPRGPWSEPIKLDIQGIDPGHIATASGKRYLYVNRGRMSPLSNDGMSTTAKPQKLYDGWKYPSDWIVECFCLESPKLFQRNDFYYLVSAQGGTSGPSTSHMAVVARSKSPEGPWENSPINPLIHTYSNSEPLVSKGHATLFDDVKGNWWAIYHGYENGYLPSGRNTLIEKVEWTNDGWPKVFGNKATANQYHTIQNYKTENDNFNANDLKLQWVFSGLDSLSQFSIKNGSLQIICNPTKTKALMCQPSDKNYEAIIKFSTQGVVSTGLTVFYDEKIFTGIEYDNHSIQSLIKAEKHLPKITAQDCKYLKMRIENYKLQLYWSSNGKKWIAYSESMDLSNYHTNNLHGFKNLKIGIIGKGNGTLLIDSFRYKKI